MPALRAALSFSFLLLLWRLQAALTSPSSFSRKEKGSPAEGAPGVLPPGGPMGAPMGAVGGGPLMVAEGAPLGAPSGSSLSSSAADSRVLHALWCIIRSTFRRFKVKKSVVFAIDGVPPLAKLGISQLRRQRAARVGLLSACIERSLAGPPQLPTNTSTSAIQTETKNKEETDEQQGEARQINGDNDTPAPAAAAAAAPKRSSAYSIRKNAESAVVMVEEVAGLLTVSCAAASLLLNLLQGEPSSSAGCLLIAKNCCCFCLSSIFHSICCLRV